MLVTVVFGLVVAALIYHENRMDGMRRQLQELSQDIQVLDRRTVNVRSISPTRAHINQLPPIFK